MLDGDWEQAFVFMLMSGLVNLRRDWVAHEQKQRTSLVQLKVVMKARGGY